MERVGIFCSACDVAEKYMNAARELGRWLGENGKTVIYGGANCGMMGAVSHEAKAAGARLFGMIPMIPSWKPLESDELDVTFPCEGLTDRKDLMMLESEIFIALPGGIGTLDEIFTVVSMTNIKLSDKKMILYNVDGYWDQLIAMLDDMGSKGFLRESYKQYLILASSIDEIKALLAG